MSTARELGERIKVLAASYAAATQHDDSDWLKEARSLLHDKIDALVSLAQPGEGALTGWQSIETAPEDGEFLVYMPEERTKFQVARYHPNVKVIGNTFAFDLTKPTHWRPLPPPPGTPKESEHG